MAKKRLNKKVALVGSAVLILLGLALIYLIPKFALVFGFIGPETFIKDGDAAIKAAQEATDEQTKAEEYRKAERNYGKARGLAKTDELRCEMLFKLADIYIETGQWPKVLGCWNEIISIDPKNVKARLGRLKYFYIMADSGLRHVWQEVASQASEFIDVADVNRFAEDTAKWETSGMQEREAAMQRLGPYLYLLRGRANLEVARMGAVTDPDELLFKATADFEKVREVEPGEPQVCWYLAQAVKTKGEILASRGNFEERDRAAKQAKEILEQAVEVASADPRAHINLLKEKLDQSSVGTQPQEQIQLLEPEYLLLVERFPSSAEAFSSLAEFYRRLGHKNLDKNIEAAEKALELDKPNVTYAINAANLHYRNFSIYGQKQEIHKAIEVAKNALTLPDAQEVSGPRHWANLKNKISLYTFLANCYIKQILEPLEVRTESQTKELMTDAEQAVHEIEQLLGSGEEPQVIKWQGMLELAKGNRNIAVRKLYKAYELLKASGRSDAQLSYALAKIFKNTSEVGAVREFLESALAPDAYIQWTKPEAVLDYVDVLIKMRAYDVALSIVNSFEERYWANKRSQTLRISALLGAGQFDEAEAELAKAEPDDPNTMKLNLALVQAKIGQLQRIISRKQIKESSPIVFEGLEVPKKEAVEPETSVQLMTDELKGYWTVCAELVEKLLVIDPNSVGEASVVAVCNNYIAQGQKEQARGIVNRFLGYFPDNTTVLFYKRVLAEPAPDKVSQQRRKEIEEQVLSEIDDPIRRVVKLGLFYHRHEELDKAAGEFKKVFSSSVAREVYREKKNTQRDIRNLQYEIAVSYLFEIALGRKDWELAEEIVETVRREDIDGCGGQFFAARVAMAKEEYKDALTRLEECLRQRPVFSHGFMLRSNVHTILGNEHSSIEDARKAASLNPLDGTIARVLANVLYQRNRKLGSNVSSDQVIQARTALDSAMALNPGDMALLSDYAEYISPTREVRALAIRQYLQKTAPSVKNAVLLGRLATKIALEEANAERKEALFAIAASSFEQAIVIEPQNKAALEAQAEYHRLRGQQEKAEEVLKQNPKLLWRLYFRSGRFEDAKAVLEELYKTEAKDSDVVKGLLLVAERAADKEAVQKYSEELLSFEDSVENHLFQIQTFLKIGLIKEAEYKLQSFKERYPAEMRALLLEAWLAMKQGRLKEALELTNRSLESNQNNALAWRVRGEVNFLMANYNKAIDDLKRSKSLSLEPDTRVALAKAYQRAGRYEDAIIELKSTIENPQAATEGVPAEHGARALLEQIYLQLGRKGELKKFYDETLRKFPDSVLWCNRAGAFAIAEGEFDRAEQLYGQAWQKGQKDSKGDGAPKRYEGRLGPREAAFDGYLQALVLSGKFDKVFEEGRKYVGGDLAPIAYLRMAEARLKLGDKTIAIEYCRKAVDKVGTNEIFASEVSQRMYLLLGAEEVLRHCEERLKDNPDSLAANLTMFNLAKLNGEYNKALGYIDKCLKIAGPDSSARLDYTSKKVEILHLAYEKTSDNNYLRTAITVYESLLAEMPNNMRVLNNLAYMLAENNERLAKALMFAKRALDTMPNNPSFLDTYAYVLYKNGRNSEAAEFLQAALQQYEQNSISIPTEVYEHLGQICEELGTEAEALAAYKQALEIVLNSPAKSSKAVRQRITSAIERLTLVVEK